VLECCVQEASKHRAAVEDLKLVESQHKQLLTNMEVWSLFCEKNVLVHGQVTIIFVVSVGLSVCLFVCAEFFSAVFDPISIKLGHRLYVWV